VAVFGGNDLSIAELGDVAPDLRDPVALAQEVDVPLGRFATALQMTDGD
jgi:hypothetical protein